MWRQLMPAISASLRPVYADNFYLLVRLPRRYIIVRGKPRTIQ